MLQCELLVQISKTKPVDFIFYLLMNRWQGSPCVLRCAIMFVHLDWLCEVWRNTPKPSILKYTPRPKCFNSLKICFWTSKSMCSSMNVCKHSDIILVVESIYWVIGQIERTKKIFKSLELNCAVSFMAWFIEKN